jgi:ribA/ribD-fused uncharacterized protein
VGKDNGRDHEENKGDSKVTALIVSSFRGQHEFLSNFYMPAPLFYDGDFYPSAEHAYQAAKCSDKWMRERIRKVSTPGKARHLGKMVQIVEGWDHKRLQVMYDVVFHKFSVNPYLQKRLLELSEYDLIEGNNWGDTFWGVYNGEGENNLGKILMRVRDEVIVVRSCCKCCRVRQ